MSVADLRFDAMGTDCRVLVDAGEPEAAAARARAVIDHAAERLTRFTATSELSMLNASRSPVVAVSPLLAEHVAAARWAAEASGGGLVDPTLLGDLEAAGYGADGLQRAPAFRALLAAAPQRRPARPAAVARWRAVRVAGRLVGRPPGVRLDLGGTAKGLAADHALAALGPVRAAVVDCGGDLAVGGGAGAPVPVVVRHPMSGERLTTLRLARGGVATSGIALRAWRGPDGAPAHHLLDPARRAPAWTGVLSATALAPSALAAEILAKTAVLVGPLRAPAVLAEHGGVVIREDGVDLVAPATGAPALEAA